MSETIPTEPSAGGPGHVPEGVLLVLFAATLFLSAFLLFGVQPMFAKLVLPTLGGSAAVWSVAMVFFQAVLLAGYAYAHLLTRLPLRVAVAVHLVTLAAGAMALPIGLPAGWGLPPETGTALWLIGLFAMGVGLPFFAVSINGPLLQAWFARTGHRHAADPYFLYGASNVGSFAALLAYPVLVEPTLGARMQAVGWGWGFALLAVLVAVCGLVTLRAPRSVAAMGVAAEAEPAPTAARRASWTALAFVPSGLLVAVTAHLSTDVAAVPFLWVVPLALFLATFVLTFRQNPWPKPVVVHVLQPIMVGIVICSDYAVPLPLPAEAWILLVTFFLSALLCHGELVRRRPGPRHLTEFYLWMSLGGVLGGLFSGLIAPAVFDSVLEFPILLVATLLCRPGLFEGGRKALQRDLHFLAIPAMALPLPALGNWSLAALEGKPFGSMIGIAVGLALFQRKHVLRYAGLIALILTAIHVYEPGNRTVHTERSFYGVHRVLETPDGEFRTLFHGTTVHGAMRLSNPDGTPVTGRPERLTYYWPGSGIGRSITALRAKHKGRIGSVSVVGLGSGTLACASEPGETWRFLEIDPVVVQIARDPALFRFIPDCAPDAPVILGDARLTLAAPDMPLSDLMIIDAFSSDAIPVHLLTREALALYRSRLNPGGVVVFHVSNRHMELASVVAAVAEAEGMVAYAAVLRPPEGARQIAASLVVAVAAKPADLGPLMFDPEFYRIRAKPEVSVWTDDVSDVLSAIIRGTRDERGYDVVN